MLSRKETEILDGNLVVIEYVLQCKTTFLRRDYTIHLYSVYKKNGTPVIETVSEKEFKLFMLGLKEGYLCSEEGEKNAYAKIYGF